MLTLRPFTTLLVSFLAVACIPEPIAPKAGLYTVEVDVLTDDCTPGYEVTSYRTHVRVDPESLRFEIAQGLADGPELVEDAQFARADGDTLEYVSDPKTTQIGCMTVTRTTTVTLGHDEYLSVLDEEQWVRTDVPGPWEDALLELDTTTV